MKNLALSTIESIPQKAPVHIPGNDKEDFVKKLADSIAMEFQMDNRAASFIDTIISEAIKPYTSRSYGGIKYADN